MNCTCAQGHPHASTDQYKKSPHAELSRRSLLGLSGLAATTLATSTSFVGSCEAQAQSANSRAVDIHAHYYPQAFLKAVAEEGGPPYFQIDMSNPATPILPLGAARLALDPTYWDLDKRIERMNAQGVQMHALSLTLPMVHWAQPQRGAKLARIVNDAMAEANAAHPGRFVGCATLPLQDPALAVAELKRVEGIKAIRAIYLPTNAITRELSDPAFFPIYEQCEGLNLPVMLHPIGVIGAERLGAHFYLNNLLGNPFDSTIAAAHLVFGGVMDRFPKLNVVLPHGGGALPYLWGRLEHGQEVRVEVKGKAKLPFHEYLRRFHYDTIGHASELVQFLVAQMGADRVMLGSDYCFDMGYERPREIVNKLDLPAAQKELIFGGNAARLLHLA
jgi:aminocarboxymuconate-semialdehyde decarboxylase